MRTVTDASGTPAYHLAYEPFGTLREVRDGSGTPLPDPAAWPVALAGFHTLDHEPTGLLYARARWLDPATGRFLSPDPAGGGYGYAFANPVVFTDPGGLWPHTPFSAYLHTMADIAGYVAVGTLAAALVVGAPLTAPLVGATLLATGAVMLAADVVHATGTCTSSKGNCGTALAMAGVAAAGGRYLRPLRALKTVRNSRPATLTPRAPTFLGDAAAPIGRRGSPIDIAPGTNPSATIGGRRYTGHALDRMQGRGIMPGAVDDAIRYNPAVRGVDGSFIHYSQTNNISVVLNADGSVRTVSHGLFKAR